MCAKNIRLMGLLVCEISCGPIHMIDTWPNTWFLTPGGDNKWLTVSLFYVTSVPFQCSTSDLIFLSWCNPCIQLWLSVWKHAIKHYFEVGKGVLINSLKVSFSHHCRAQDSAHVSGIVHSKEYKVCVWKCGALWLSLTLTVCVRYW